MIKLTQSDPNFDRLHYVSRAIAKKDTREHLNHLYVDEDGQAIGSDGHRLHFATDGEYGRWLEPGFYEVLKRTKTMLWLEKVEVDSKYPNIAFIIEGRPNGSGQWQTMKLNGLHGASVVGYRAAKDYDYCVQYPYIEDAIAYSKNFELGKGNDQLWFDFGDVQAVIMRLRV